MVDAERLLAVLGRVTARLAILERYADAAEDDTAIEACIDAAHHVVAARGLGTPASNADALRVLARAELLEDTLAASMAGSVGFRNVLVHGDAEVDDRLVVENLSHLPALRGSRHVARTGTMLTAGARAADTRSN